MRSTDSVMGRGSQFLARKGPFSPIPRLIVIVLATMRLTRFVVADTLGEWLIVRPAMEWAAKDIVVPQAELEGHPPEFVQEMREYFDEKTPREKVEYGKEPPYASKRAQLVSGLDCPFCVGFWIGLAVILLSFATRVPVVGPLIRFAGVGLALNYVVAHVSSRIDS